MTQTGCEALGALMNRPEVMKATASHSQEMIDRRNYRPPLCSVFMAPLTALVESNDFVFEVHPEARRQLPTIIDNSAQRVIPVENPDPTTRHRYGRQRTIGIVFSGGPAPGGHNVIAGLFDMAKQANPDTRLFGFILGPDGILENEAIEITSGMVDAFRNLGGFTMIKTGRTKIDSRQKMELSRETFRQLGLDALVVVGGDDSNTNAAFLAQEMASDGIQVIGVPKTIDGDIQVRDARGEVLCATSFGFHSAARAFAENIGHLCTDSSSDMKYWHICKVMGRVASHLALEVALQTHANLTLIGEELADYLDHARIEAAAKQGTVDYTAYGMTLRRLSRLICEAVVRRAAVGKNFGVIVIPEGVLEFINEIQVFIIKLSTIIAEYNATHDADFHSAFPTLAGKLEYLRRLAQRSRDDRSYTTWNSRDDDLFNDIPDFFQEGLLTERDSHGNFQFSLVETDKVLMGLVTDYLKILAEKGQYKLGIAESYYRKVLDKAGLDPERFGPSLFSNWGQAEYLLVRQSIISNKTLHSRLVKDGLIAEGEKIPPAVEKIYQKSVPKFKTQTHFYGYDGRGTNPTRFDCTYTYNLGLTAFSLIANGATGQMAAIRNLEGEFEQWEPIGIPIAPLMRLEERKGKLTLVLEKSIVDLNSVSFKIYQACRESWLAAVPGDDPFRCPGPIRYTGQSEEDRPITLVLNALSSEMPRSEG